MEVTDTQDVNALDLTPTMMIESYIGGFYLKDEKGNVVGETHPGCKELIFQFLENHGYKPSDSADVWIREKIDNSSILPEQSKKSMIPLVQTSPWRCCVTCKKPLEKNEFCYCINNIKVCSYRASIR